jgi:hypothetical protein
MRYTNPATARPRPRFRGIQQHCALKEGVPESPLGHCFTPIEVQTLACPLSQPLQASAHTITTAHFAHAHNTDRAPLPPQVNGMWGSAVGGFT